MQLSMTKEQADIEALSAEVEKLKEENKVLKQKLEQFNYSNTTVDELFHLDLIYKSVVAQLYRLSEYPGAYESKAAMQSNLLDQLKHITIVISEATEINEGRND